MNNITSKTNRRCFPFQVTWRFRKRLTFFHDFIAFLELTCPECQITYKYAAELLKHFAEHVELSERDQVTKKLKKLPDLQPIKPFCRTNVPSRIEEMLCERISPEDVESPLTFCEVTMEEAKTNEIKTKTVERKYRCSYCSRCFGWSTDLKRHILTHTGERPFECKLCISKFTRKFLLQKHMVRRHHVDEGSGSKSKVPGLKPIDSVLKTKSRKQEKCNIRRKSGSSNFELTDGSIVCSNWFSIKESNFF